MPPVPLALLEVVVLFVAFWTSRTTSPRGKKWGLRAAAVVVVFILSSALAPDPRAAAVSGEYTVYFGIPAIIVYFIAKGVVGRRRA